MFAAKNQQLTRPSGGYVIPRSLRFRSSASAYLNRTFGTPTDNKKFTISVWMKRGTLGSPRRGWFSTTGLADYFEFDASDRIRFSFGNDSNAALISNQVFRDPSAWYHIVTAVDTTQATAANRFRVYVNGVEITSWGTASYPAQNFVPTMNSAVAHNIAADYNLTAGQYFDGYFAEMNFVDGQALAPTSFGATNATTGVWAPIKYTGTYGINGFHLDFNSYATTAALGTDTSGNGNTWTVNNVSVTAGVTYDSMIDVPTVTDTGSNYCTMMPNAMSSGYTLADGNLTTGASAASPASIAFTSIGMVTGKYYWEITVGSINNTNLFPRYGVSLMDTGFDATSYPDANTMEFFATSDGTYGGRIRVYGGTFYGTYAAVAVGAVIGHAYDASTGKIWISKNGVWYTGDPSANTSPWATLTNFIGYTVYPSVAERSSSSNVNFGQRPFAYSVPTGYSTLNTYNLPAPSILKGAAHMAATTYTGTGASLTVANTVNSTSFQPDLVWIKSRSAATNNIVFNSIRAATNYLISNSTVSEATNANTLTAFGSTGFTLGSDASSIGVNVNAATYVAWQWKGSGTTVSNTNGSITSTVCVNQTAGFSIAQYTGTGANATVGHGLGVAPSMIILFDTVAANNHNVYHSSLANTQSMLLNAVNAVGGGATYWNSTSPTSSVFSLGSNVETNQSTHPIIAYCFAPIAGYSAFGTYSASASADGPFIYLGFRPAWVMIKVTTAGDYWEIMDSKRPGYNCIGGNLHGNDALAETTPAIIDFLSNGFKIRSAGDGVGSAQTMIYAAFAESPFKNSLAR
jgi:hypothetical protein